MNVMMCEISIDKTASEGDDEQTGGELLFPLCDSYICMYKKENNSSFELKAGRLCSRNYSHMPTDGIPNVMIQ